MYLLHVSRSIAHIRNQSLESLAASSTRTAVELFGLDRKEPV
jgi:hypothetical protein